MGSLPPSDGSAPSPAWIEIDGLHNARDLGGLPVAGGGRTRPGVLLRSDAPDRLGPEACRRLVDEIGIRLVVDLRSPAEQPAAGVRCGPGATELRLPLMEELDPAAVTELSPELVPVYLGFTDRLAGHAPDLLATMLDDGLPTLVAGSLLRQ